VVQLQWVWLVSSRMFIQCGSIVLVSWSKGSGGGSMGQGGVWRLCRVAGVQRVVSVCGLVMIICSIMERWIWVE